MVSPNRKEGFSGRAVVKRNKRRAGRAVSYRGMIQTKRLSVNELGQSREPCVAVGVATEVDRPISLLSPIANSGLFFTSRYWLLGFGDCV